MPQTVLHLIDESSPLHRHVEMGTLVQQQGLVIMVLHEALDGLSQCSIGSSCMFIPSAGDCIVGPFQFVGNKWLGEKGGEPWVDCGGFGEVEVSQKDCGDCALTAAGGTSVVGEPAPTAGACQNHGVRKQSGLGGGGDHLRGLALKLPRVLSTRQASGRGGAAPAESKAHFNSHFKDLPRNHTMQVQGRFVQADNTEHICKDTLNSRFRGWVRVPWARALPCIVVIQALLCLLAGALVLLEPGAVGGTGGGTSLGGFADVFFWAVQVLQHALARTCFVLTPAVPHTVPQTFGTIGYGALAPQRESAYVNIVANLTGIFGTLFIGVVGGFLITKVAVLNCNPLVLASDKMLLTTDAATGNKVLKFRLQGYRAEQLLLGVHVQAYVLGTKELPSGQSIGDMRILKLRGEYHPVLLLGGTVEHVIDEESPLFPWKGVEELEKGKKIERIRLKVEGTDGFFRRSFYGYFGLKVGVIQEGEGLEFANMLRMGEGEAGIEMDLSHVHALRALD